MKQTDTPPDDGHGPADSRLSALIQGVALPAVPGLESATRRRIEQHSRRRIVVLAVGCLAVVLGGLGLLQTIVPGENRPQQAQAVPLNEQELASLFAPPPVDPLTLLDRQQQVSFQTLKQWERSQ